MERALWLSVLLAGLNDAARGHGLAWLYTRDFRIVCHMAEVSPELVKVIFQRDHDRFANTTKG